MKKAESVQYIMLGPYERAKMMALETHINGKQVCIAGIEGLNLLSGMVVWHVSREVWDFQVRGMTDEKGYAEHINWIDQELRLGDTVTLKVVETAESDMPKRRYRAK